MTRVFTEVRFEPHIANLRWNGLENISRIIGKKIQTKHLLENTKAKQNI